jgi:UDP-N-acetylmuramyl-tripeptide synthetase
MLLTELLKKLRNRQDVTARFTEDVLITGICPDASRVKPGNLFIAIEGLRADGHGFIDEAKARGAAALAVSRGAVDDGRVNIDDLGLPILISCDTRELMAYLFAAWYDNPQDEMKIVGVTGTNGKTSVTTLIKEILSRAFIPSGLIGTAGCYSKDEKIDVRSANENANMTTPDPEELYRILRIMADGGVRVVLMETTSHALALKKVEPINFEIAVFTNLTEDHLDLHKNMENYFAAKARLFEKCRLAVINYDDRYGRILAENIDIPHIFCSAEGRETDCAAEDVRVSGGGIEYKLTSRDLRLRVRSPLCGKFNVMNTMQAAVISRALGATATTIKDTLAHFSGVVGRLERVKLAERVDFSVYIDYAHTPDALENLLCAARTFAKSGQRIVLLFGCGGDRDRQKRPVMGKIAVDMADFVIITGDNSRSEKTLDIIKDILSGIVGREGAPFTVIERRRDAIEYAIKNARRGDVILLAGKGHEEYEIDEDGKHPFSERMLVKEFAEKYY